MKIFDFIEFYSTHRLHQNLHYKTPNEVYNEDVNVDAFIYAKRNKLALFIFKTVA